MRRISRIDRPIGLLRRQTNTRIPSPYLCLTCKHQITSFSTSTRKAAPSNEKAPFTEKVRQRIWGTDKPPGLEDPYGDTSIFDKTKEQAREQELEGPPKRVEESATDNIEDVEGYEPATSWADLQWVGGDPVWQPEEDFEGFAPADAAKDSEQITAALHRAIVEVFALQQVGKPLHELSDYGVNPNDDWTDDVRITPSPSGATLEMPGGASLQQVMELLKANTMDEEDYEVKTTESQEDIVADRSEVDSLKDAVTPSTEPASENAEPTESQEDTAADRSPEDPLVESKTYCEVISSWDPSWLQISLENPDVKFAVLKRTMQLTGIRIPDAAIKSSNTAKTLLNILVTPPKPRKLVEALAQKTDLLQLENVTIYTARRSFYDKENDIGRLKVIKKELQARGLDL